jgi:methylated-DNA-[protein]-cysteine S-methyltransferase
MDNKTMRHGRTSKARDYDAVVATPVGRLGIVVHDGALVDVAFLGKSTALHAPRTDMARRASRQLRSYFTNPRQSFRIPLKLEGTPFQQRVWRALRRIPAGRTLSYGTLARRLHTSARAVGNACRANPIPLVVPCHRVVAANGLGGFMGKRSGLSLSRKYWLLEHERGE